MTKKKRIITRLLVVLAALTLISCCFLGSTFARYTSSNSGTASVEVAKWNANIAVEGTGTPVTVTFEKLSPSKKAFDSSATNARSNKTDRKLVATVTNTNSAVDALFEVALSADGIKLTTEDTKTADYNEEKAKSVFSITLSYTTSATPTENDFKSMTSFTILADGSTTATSDTVFDNDTTVYIYAQLTWTSQDKVTDATAETSDGIDTMVGRNVKSVSIDVTYTATQVTQIPAGA